jgi:hypothetical protein
MKKIVSIVVVAMMVLSLALSAAAASGINKGEAELLEKFDKVVDSYSFYNKGLANQYKNEAENALTKVDLDDDAVKALSDCIDAVVAYAEKNGINSIEAARKAKGDVVAMVNAVANKYGINVSVGEDGQVCVTVNGDKVASNSGLVKQTGADMTVTYVVIGALVIAFICGVAVVSKKNLLSNN